MDARFIALEGIDGTGTTTQGAMLRNWLTAQGQRCVLTAEPTRGPIGVIIRLGLTGRLRFLPGAREHGGDEATYALLFAADRVDHLLNEIEPALESGAWVVTDRYYLSSLAYQHLECDVEWLRQINRYCRRPDVTFLLDAAPELCLERIGKGRNNLERYEQLEKLNAIRRNYLEISKILRADGEEIVVIDASQPPDAVHREIIARIEKTSSA